MNGRWRSANNNDNNNYVQSIGSERETLKACWRQKRILMNGWFSCCGNLVSGTHSLWIKKVSHTVSIDVFCCCCCSLSGRRKWHGIEYNFVLNYGDDLRTDRALYTAPPTDFVVHRHTHKGHNWRGGHVQVNQAYSEGFATWNRRRGRRRMITDWLTEWWSFTFKYGWSTSFRDRHLGSGFSNNGWQSKSGGGVPKKECDEKREMVTR